MYWWGLWPMRDLSGQKYNKLTIIEKASSERNGDVKWNCECDCGNFVKVSTDHLTRKKNPVKSCGCIRLLYGRDHKDWKGYGDISGSWWCIHVLREINQKKRHSIEVSLTIEYAWNLFLKQNRECALTGMPLTIASRAEYGTASLDRIDSAKGYTTDNVQWVHKDVNFMKRNYDQGYFVQMCVKIAKKHGGL